MNKGGRPKKEPIHYPAKHSFVNILFDIEDINTHQLVRLTGVSPDQVRTKVEFKRVQIRPTKMKRLTDNLGHKGTHRLLKRYGPAWICKEGRIFFESDHT